MTKTLRLLKLLKNGYSQILNANLVGIYLHGSYVFDSYNYSVSDLDYLVVVKKPLSLKDKQYLMEFTLSQLWPISPAKGLEFHVLLLKDTQNFSHPLPFDFHFSKAHYQEYLADKQLYLNNMHGTDPDLAAHIMIINYAGRTLVGEPIQNVFSVVPKNDYWASIYFDIANARENIIQEPTYTILNLCRVLAYKKEQIITSKLTAGKWGVSRLPAIYAPVIKLAVDDYTSGRLIERNFDKKNLFAFADYMLDRIKQ